MSRLRYQRDSTFGANAIMVVKSVVNKIVSKMTAPHGKPSSVASVVHCCIFSWFAEHEKTCAEDALGILVAACKVTVPMATAEILLDFLLAEGEADGGGMGGGLTGTAAAATCSLYSLRAAYFPVRIRAIYSSSS